MEKYVLAVLLLAMISTMLDYVTYFWLCDVWRLWLSPAQESIPAQPSYDLQLSVWLWQLARWPTFFILSSYIGWPPWCNDLLATLTGYVTSDIQLGIKAMWGALCGVAVGRTYTQVRTVCFIAVETEVEFEVRGGVIYSTYSIDSG